MTGLVQPQWSTPIASIFVGLLTNTSKLQSRKGADRKERTENLSYVAWHELLAQRLDGWYDYREIARQQAEEAQAPIPEPEVPDDYLPRGWKPYNANERPAKQEPVAMPAEQDYEITELLDELGWTNPLRVKSECSKTVWALTAADSDSRRPLLRTVYHTLPIYYRVRILYTLVSSMLSCAGKEGVEAHKFYGGGEVDALKVKKMLMEFKPTEMRGQFLGEDSKGNRYFHCGQYTSSDFRVYRQATKITQKQRQEAKAAEKKGGMKRQVGPSF